MILISIEIITIMMLIDNGDNGDIFNCVDGDISREIIIILLLIMMMLIDNHDVFNCADSDISRDNDNVDNGDDSR